MKKLSKLFGYTAFSLGVVSFTIYGITDTAYGCTLAMNMLIGCLSCTLISLGLSNGR